MTNKGAATILQNFPELITLNLARTVVTRVFVPRSRSLQSLNLTNCKIDLVFEDSEAPAPMAKLILAEASFESENEALMYVKAVEHLDLSCSLLRRYILLRGMEAMEHLDLSWTSIEDDALEDFVFFGANLKFLNLSWTRVTCVGLATLALLVPVIEWLSLADTNIDDLALPFIGKMASLKSLDLTNTKIRGLHVSFL